MVSDPQHPLTEDGKNWLIQVCDPFHDRPFKKSGWVDNNTRPTVVRQVKQSLAISATSGGAAAPANPWDCHISWLPVIHPSATNPSASRVNNIITANAATTVSVGGLTAMAQFSSGSAVSWTPATGSTNFLGQLGVDQNYTLDDTRMVGVGFEVTDTSAEINKQGMLTIYSYPQDGPEDVYTVLGNGGASALTASWTFGKRIYLPPTTVADAMLLPESRQWEAKYGAYVVPTFQDIHNPVTSNTCKIPVYESILQQYPAAVANSTGCNIPSLPNTQSEASTGTVITLNTYCSNYQKIVPMNSSGVILSGLHPSSTFMLTLVYYLETIPSLSNKGLVVLTEPPPVFDPFALQLYTEIITRLPPGCMVGENDNGEWFWNIVEKVADVAAPVLSMIPHPIAQAGAAVANGLKSKNQISHTPFSPSTDHLVNATPIRPVVKQKRKKVKSANRNLAAGNRTIVTKKGKVKQIQGPMRGPDM